MYIGFFYLTYLEKSLPYIVRFSQIKWNTADVFLYIATVDYPDGYFSFLYRQHFIHKWDSEYIKDKILSNQLDFCAALDFYINYEERVSLTKYIEVVENFKRINEITYVDV